MTKEAQEFIDRGVRFEALQQMPVWGEIKAFLKGAEQATIDNLVSYQGSDPDVIRTMHTMARAVKGVRQSLEGFVATAIEDYHQTVIEQTLSEE